MRRTLFALLVIFYTSPTLATDEIVCDSKTFKATLAVGSDGSVPSMTLSDSSGRYLSGVLGVTDLPKKSGSVSIQTQSIDLRVILRTKEGATELKICINNGEGHIVLGRHREKMTCDWET